jgi:hypothetical protein
LPGNKGKKPKNTIPTNTTTTNWATHPQPPSNPHHYNV